MANELNRTHAISNYYLFMTSSKFQCVCLQFTYTYDGKIYIVYGQKIALRKSRISFTKVPKETLESLRFRSRDHAIYHSLTFRPKVAYRPTTITTLQKERKTNHHHSISQNPVVNTTNAKYCLFTVVCKLFGQKPLRKRKETAES